MSYLNSREIKDNNLLKESRLLWNEYARLKFSIKSSKEFTKISRLLELHRKLYGAALDIKELIK